MTRRPTRLLLFACCICCFACQPPDPAHTLDGTWTLVAFEHPASGQVDLPPAHLGAPVQLACRDRGRRGHFVATTATNTYRSGYLLSGPGTLAVDQPLEATLLGETAWGLRLRDALPLLHSYTRADQTLVLAYGDTGWQMRWSSGGGR
ncbi:MAG: hypothetical protein OHK0039_44680 [Bacteroidia bacterium]